MDSIRTFSSALKNVLSTANLLMLKSTRTKPIRSLGTQSVSIKFGSRRLKPQITMSLKRALICLFINHGTLLQLIILIGGIQLFRPN